MGNPEMKASRKLAGGSTRIEKVGSGIARDDAVDRQEQAGGQGEELTAPRVDPFVLRRG